ncbi:hypothetical protein VM1G_12015 [Cytospora mali]|uniref:Uncharacterized protein n=1 Tax=Cytospora mali TaxID=578113 RepID=A0A194VI14_CYTMA|nr:hypothetical protein VM1G_12015 [Valsa mali]
MAEAEEPVLVGGYQIDELLENTTFDLAYRGHIDAGLWFASPAPDATEEHLITRLASTLASYAQQNLYDDDLFVAYREDFAAWTPEMFERLPAPCRRSLKNFLRTRGVFTGRNNQPVAPQLYALAQAEERLPWTDAELRNVPLAPESCMNEYRTAAATGPISGQPARTGPTNGHAESSCATIAVRPTVRPTFDDAINTTIVFAKPLRKCPTNG